MLCHPGVAQQACSGALCCRATLMTRAASAPGCSPLMTATEAPTLPSPNIISTLCCAQRGELVALVPPELVVAVGPRSLDISVSAAHQRKTHFSDLTCPLAVKHPLCNALCCWPLHCAALWCCFAARDQGQAAGSGAVMTTAHAHGSKDVSPKILTIISSELCIGCRKRRRRGCGACTRTLA